MAISCLSSCTAIAYAPALPPKHQPPMWSPGLWNAGIDFTNEFIAAYPMWEGGGLLLHDYSSNNRDITMPSATSPTWTRKAFGTCLSFDGSTKFLDLPDYETLGDGTVPGDWGVSVWFNTQFNNSDVGRTCIVFSSDFSGTDGIQIASADEGCNQNFVVGVDGNYGALCYLFEKNVWNHVVLYRIGANAYCWVNGAHVGTIALDSAAASKNFQWDTVKLGCRVVSSLNNDFFGGEIGNLTLWARPSGQFSSTLSDGSRLKELFEEPWLMYTPPEPPYMQDGTTYDPTGGAVAGSTGTVSSTYSSSPSGGVVAGSTGTVRSTYSSSPSGGVVCGGTANVSMAIAVGGGVVCGGSAAVNVLTGGVKCGGTAAVQEILYAFPSGGVVTSGVAYITQPSKQIVGSYVRRVPFMQHLAPQWPYTINRDSPQMAGLVAWWPGQGGGAKVFDVSGYGHHGTHLGGTTWAGSNRSNSVAISYDGTDDYTDLGYHVNWDLHAYSITGWFRTTDKSNHKGIINKLVDDTNINWSFFIWGPDDLTYTNGALVFKATSQGNVAFQLASSSDCADGQWHSFCGVVNNNDTTAKLYVDGLLVDETGSIPDVDTPDSNVILGADRSLDEEGAPLTDRHFTGLLEDIRIYNINLSTTQIMAVNAPVSRFDLYHRISLNNLFHWIVPTASSDTSQGGVIVGGTASSPAILNETPSGGVVVGGSTTEVYLPFVSGGVVIGGTTPINETIATSGGVVVGGSSNIHTELPTGGVVVAGTALVQHVVGEEDIVTADDVSFVYSGGNANNDPNQSLGGDSSPFPILDAINNLFDDVQQTEVSFGTTDYRAFYIFNDHSESSILDAKVWVEIADTVADIAIGVGPLNQIAASIGIENNPPAGVTFSQPTTAEDAIMIGDMAPLDGFYVWVRRTISADLPETAGDGFTLRFQGMD